MAIPPLLAVRADGGPGVGVGHLARSLALVQAWMARKGRAVMVTRAAPQFWVQQFIDAGCSVVGTTPEQPADWWAVDRYERDAGDAAPAGARVLFVDDHDTSGTGGTGADLVVDHNLGTGWRTYPAARERLLGPRYALLRRESQPWESPRAVPEVARRIVLVLGGSPSEETSALGEAVGSDTRLAKFEVRMLNGSDDISAELAAADVAVAAAGTVTWEACLHGIPAVLVAVAPNQIPVATRVAEAGAAIHVPAESEAVTTAVLALAEDATRRVSMSRAGQALVDGLGARRVACRLRSHLLTLRDVTESDARLIFEWSNDPATRAASFSSEPIGWDQHVTWLRSRLQRPGSASYIATNSVGADLGLVRLDESDEGEAEIGVSVAPSRRGEGWGGAVVDAGCRRWASTHGRVLVRARIKVGNEASVGAFQDADFDEEPSHDASVLRYARHLDGDEPGSRPRGA